MPFWVAVTLLEQGEAAGLAEAREIFERLECDAVARARAIRCGAWTKTTYCLK